jgi:TonB family protein
MAMSYPPRIPKLKLQLPGTESVPFLTSLGLHILVGVALPSLSSMSQEPKAPGDRTVSLLELTPEELERIPNPYSTPTESLDDLTEVPPFPNTPLSEQTVEPTFSFPSRSSFLPPPPSATTLEPLGSLPSIPRGQFSTVLPKLPSIALPPPPSQTPVFSTRNNLPQLPTTSETEISPENRLLPNFPPLPEARQIDPSLPPESLLPRWRPLEEAEKDQELSGNNNQATPQASPTPDVVAIRQRNLQADLERRRQSLIADNSNTTPEEARKNYVDWLADVGNRDIQPEEKTIQGTYPKDACVRKLDGTAVFGVLVGDNGQVTNFHLIKSAGYPILNEQALRDIQRTSFSNSTGQAKPYRVNVNFGYNQEICPNLAVPEGESSQTPAETATPKPTPEAVQTPVETPKPKPTPETEETPVETPKPKPTPETEETPVETPKPKPTPETEETPVETPKPKPTPETVETPKPSPTEEVKTPSELPKVSREATDLVLP